MEKVTINEYVLKDPKFKEDRTVVNISDIHSNITALSNIEKLLEEIKANYIYIPGDLIDSIDNIHNEEIISLLKKIGNISPTFLSLGNHEMCELSYQKGKKKEIESDKYVEYFDSIMKQTNCISMISDFSKIELSDDLSISAINVPFSYYGKKEKIIQYKKILEGSKEIINKDKFNILLLHSPNSLIQNGKIDKSSEIIKNMNLILCGHNHGGLMPIFAQDLLKGHRGLAGPYAKIFQPNAYGIYNEDDTSVLISNGVTKISSTSEAGKINKILNKIYLPEIDLIHMEQADEHLLKLKNRSIHKF